MVVSGVNRPVGYCPAARAPGLSTFLWDDDLATAEPLSTYTDIVNPTFVAVSSDRRRIYAVSEYPGAVESTLSTFSLSSTGSIELLGTVPTGGITACHVSLDRTGAFAFVSHYSGVPAGTLPEASISVHPIDAAGLADQAVSSLVFTGSGPTPRQDRPHTHCAVATRDNRFVLVADLGLDRVFVLAFDEETGAIRHHAECALPAGFGPRTIALGEEGLVVVSGELQNALAVLHFDAESGALELAGPVVPTLPPGRSGACAGVVLHPGERIAYVANRFFDSIAVVPLDDPGELDIVPLGGDIPRHHTFDPAGRYLLVTGQNSDEIIVFRPDGTTLRRVGSFETGSPTCIAFAG